MARQDLESRALATFDAFASSVNAAIAAINSEKGDDVAIATFAADAFYYDEIGTETPNHDPIAIFYPNSETDVTVAGQSSEKIMLAIEIRTTEQGFETGRQVFKMLARYRRVIRDILISKWESFRGLKITNFPPLKLMTDSSGIGWWSVAVGIEFQIAG